MSNREHILLATLGGQPQVVTFTLDLLLKKRYPISQVILLHPKAVAPRLQQSLQRLHHEFATGYYKTAGQDIVLGSQELQLKGHPITDIIDDYHADGTLDTIHQLINDLKRSSNHIHLSVSGGRRMMALLAISVATVNFDRHDHIWHIYTPEELQERAKGGAIMHMPANAGIELISTPFVPLNAYPYQPSSSFQATRNEQQELLEQQERARCRTVINALKPGPLKVLRAFSDGLRPHQVADQLSISISTVNSHKTVILQQCYNAWDIEESEHLSYHFLQARFAHYFDDHETSIPINI